MTKFESAKKHIDLREQFFQVKFNVFRRIYAHSFMFFYSQELIDRANEGLEYLIEQFGNSYVYEERVGIARGKAEQ